MSIMHINTYLVQREKIKEYENVVVLNDDTEIPIQEILLIESEAFNQIEE